MLIFYSKNFVSHLYRLSILIIGNSFLEKNLNYNRWRKSRGFGFHDIRILIKKKNNVFSILTTIRR